MASDCPACGGALAPWLEVPGGEPADRRRYLLLRCGSCRSAVTAGDPPDASAYETGVYAGAQPRARALVDAFQRMALRQPVRMLRRAGVSPGGRVLDAGAGRGRLVQALRAAGYDARGIDRAARGPAVQREAIEEHADEGLDAVVLWHTLEHLDDPAAALARVRSWLRPGGVALIAVPNALSLQARVAGGGWLHWDAPRHRVHLTPRGLAALMRAAGLEPAAWRHWVAEHNPAGMWMALLSRAGLPPGYPFHLLKRNAPLRATELARLALAGPLLAGPAIGLELAAAGGRRGGTVVVLARPR